eukprot:CAMPEP_0113639032 /NCGR_PEP_ID=MMETSP0017_2-20120614/20464_1 /TAXON_ID=2856 /ORGANISM="Cylindrotheca closterium" /LENGTH=255 /DNA_ID=CAMNT_0000550201 /DNA_START=550 /DNA_END=1317 /DNA_ORIENTATION=- /assembly_acc=CAM_ASM_000147
MTATTAPKSPLSKTTESVAPSVASEMIEQKESKTSQSAEYDEEVVPAVYQSSSFRGISLWLCPPTTEDKNKISDSSDCTVGDFYQGIINTLAEEQGTFGDFIPHITLVAALELTAEEIVEKVRNEIAPKIPPYAFEAEKVSFKNAYFQSVFVKLHADRPDSMIKQANELAKQVFPERQSDPAYMPHLSVVYGNLPKEEKQEKIVPKLQEKLKSAPAGARIPIDSIQVWSTEGPVEEWFCIETIPLTGPRASGLDV